MGRLSQWVTGSNAASDPVARAEPPRTAPRSSSLEVASIVLPESTTKELAMQIPAVAACRNLIVGAMVQFPPTRYRGDERLELGSLLTQPDPSTTFEAWLASTVDDVLFHGRAYSHVLRRDSDGFPSAIRWLPFESVTPIAEGSSAGGYQTVTGYRVTGSSKPVPIADVIRFDSTAPGILTTGARALSAATELELAARRLASVELPAGVLENTGTELSPDEATELLSGFQAARRSNGVAFLQGVTYKREQLSPADLQLLEARANVATEVARLFNVPVAMIGASPSGGAAAMLYANLSSQQALLVSTAVAPPLRTIEATLSLPSVTPRGQRVALDVQAYLRSDPSSAASYVTELLTAGIIDASEARSFLGIPPSSSSPTMQPGKV
jgi:HK97 family phage portal protein